MHHPSESAPQHPVLRLIAWAKNVPVDSVETYPRCEDLSEKLHSAADLLLEADDWEDNSSLAGILNAPVLERAGKKVWAIGADLAEQICRLAFQRAVRLTAQSGQTLAEVEDVLAVLRDAALTEEETTQLRQTLQMLQAPPPAQAQAPPEFHVSDEAPSKPLTVGEWQELVLSMLRLHGPALEAIAAANGPIDPQSFGRLALEITRLQDRVKQQDELLAQLVTAVKAGNGPVQDLGRVHLLLKRAGLL